MASDGSVLAIALYIHCFMNIHDPNGPINILPTPCSCSNGTCAQCVTFKIQSLAGKEGKSLGCLVTEHAAIAIANKHKDLTGGYTIYSDVRDTLSWLDENLTINTSAQLLDYTAVQRCHDNGHEDTPHENMIHMTSSILEVFPFEEDDAKQFCLPTNDIPSLEEVLKAREMQTRYERAAAVRYDWESTCKIMTRYNVHTRLPYWLRVCVVDMGEIVEKILFKIDDTLFYPPYHADQIINPKYRLQFVVLMKASAYGEMVLLANVDKDWILYDYNAEEKEIKVNPATILDSNDYIPSLIEYCRVINLIGEAAIPTNRSEMTFQGKHIWNKDGDYNDYGWANPSNPLYTEATTTNSKISNNDMNSLVSYHANLAKMYRKQDEKEEREKLLADGQSPTASRPRTVAEAMELLDESTSQWPAMDSKPLNSLDN